MNYDVQIHHDYIGNGIVMFASNEHGCATVANGRLLLNKLEAGEAMRPLLTIDYRDRNLLQSLADALATAGFFPQSHDQAKELDATREHLKDMRAIALRAVTIHLNHFENAPAGAKP